LKLGVGSSMMLWPTDWSEVQSHWMKKR